MSFLKDAFGVTLGVSKTTNYNWEQASEKIFSQETTIGVEAEAQAGQIVQVNQVTTNKKTNYFKSKKIPRMPNLFLCMVCYLETISPTLYSQLLTLMKLTPEAFF